MVVTVTPEITNEVEISPTQQEALTQPSEQAEEDKASPLQLEAQPLEEPEEVPPTSPQHEAAAEPAQLPEKVEPFSVQQEAPPESQEHLGAEASSNWQETLFQPSERPEDFKPALVQQEASAEPTEPPEEVEPFSVQQEAPPESQEHFGAEASPNWGETLFQPSERPEDFKPALVQQEASAEPTEPPEEVEPFSVQQEAPPESQEHFGAEASPNWEETLFQPSEHPEDFKPALVQQEASDEPAQLPEEVEPFSVQQEAPPESQEPFGAEASPNWEETLFQPSKHPEDFKPALVQQEASAEPTEPPEEVEPFSVQQEAPPESQEPFGAEASPNWEEILFQPSERPEDFKPALVQQEASHEPTELPEEVELSSAGQEAPSQAQEPFGAEPSPVREEAQVQPLEHPEGVKPTCIHQEASAEPAQLPEEVDPYSFKQEDPPQSLESSGAKLSPTQKEASAQMLEPPNEAELPPTLKETPAQFLWEVGPSATKQEQPAQPPEHEEMRVSTPAQPPEISMGVPAQPSLPSEVTFSPLDPGGAHQTRSPIIRVKLVNLRLFFIKPKPTEEVKTPRQQEVPSQTPMKMETSPVHQQATQQSPEPPKEVVVPHPIHNEGILSHSGQDQAKNTHRPTVTVHPLHMELNKTSELIRGFQESTALTNTTTPPYMEQVQAEKPNLTNITIKSLDLELTITTRSNVEAETSPTKQDTPTQPPKPPKEVEAQPPLYREVAAPISSEDQAPHATSPSLTVYTLDVGVRAKSTTEAEPSTVLTRTAAPSPRHLEVILPHPQQVQGQHPYPNKVTVQPVVVEVTVTQPESSETPPPTTQQSVTTNVDICEICTCQDGTLSCTGLSPEQKLRRVPVLRSNIYNGTFTIVNLQGNSISYIDENTWKSYRWVETLILSENHLSELQKDSFEGLLSLQYLDLSCNKIDSIERRTFEPLPFLQFINLGCNSITELNFGTFQAWHGMNFLDKVILERNPLTTMEDSYLLKLPALRYLDMGRTQVSLATVESILMMSLALEKLILPSHMTCCLCQFQSDIEVVCKTVKLHCNSKCPTDIIHCDETSIRNAEGPFMKVLQARKKSTNTELTIEPESPSSDKDYVSLSAFNKLDFHDKSDVISALKYILPYFSKGNLEHVESTLLPLIKLLYTNTEDEDMPLSHLANNAGGPSLNPESKDAMYQNRLMKLYSLENLLDAEIQEKIDTVKKKEKTAMLLHSKLLGPKLTGQIFQDQLDTDRAQEMSPAKTQSVQKKPLRVDRVIKGPKGIRKRYFKELAAQGIRRELIKKQEDAVSSSLKQYLMGQPSASNAPKSLSEVKNSKDIHDITFILKEANVQARNMKPISRSSKKHLFHKGHFHVTSDKAKMNQELGTDDSLKRFMLAPRPPMYAVRSLINSPAREAFSSSRELTVHENPPTESFSHLETSKGKSTTQTPYKETISTGTTTVPEKTTHEIPALKMISTANSAVTADNFQPAANPFSSTDIASPLFLSPGDQFENQLNQQLQSLIPNKDVRKLIAHVIRTFKMDCSKASVQLPCARLISRTGLLMKLFSERQEVKVFESEWDTDQWKNNNYIRENTEEAQRELKGQGPQKRTNEGKGFPFYEKLIFAIVVSVLVLLWLITCCFVEILPREKSSVERKGSSRGFFQRLLKKSSTENDSQKTSGWRRQPFWLWNWYKPTNATSKENMARKLHNLDSSDEDETVNKDTGELQEVVIEKSSFQTTESDEGNGTTHETTE